MALPFSREIATDIAAQGVVSGIASAVAGEPILMLGASSGPAVSAPSPFTPPATHDWPAGPAGFLQPHPLRFPQHINTVDQRTGQPVHLVGPAVQLVYNPLSGKGIPPQEFIEKYPQYVIPKAPPAQAPVERTGAPAREAEKMSFVSTAVGGLSALTEGLLDFGTDILDFGLGTAARLAPIAAPFIAPVMQARAPAPAPRYPAPSPTGPPPFLAPYQQPAQPAAYGGAQTVPYQPAIAMPGGGAIQTAGLGLPFIDIAPQGTVGNIVPRQVTSLRLPSRVDVPVPDKYGNMRFHTFRNLGRPLLWQGDLASCKRVRRVASRARRARGGR